MKKLIVLLISATALAFAVAACEPVDDEFMDEQFMDDQMMEEDPMMDDGF
ncbi:hypothetical protein [Spirochaeta africana]|uniref:Lipoprotein n=1 Tax=Spirochaeta africana (strain ATCC 700263 / DSM 8902 / Z-7692) TaxID=889378 RepID=H9UGR0_SPIAZ|nr:hypothetical protein [Spirochaeta africana]AFG36703.1 hypothetical protein Spiaf_0603 [Spirochaeta africana DSM 8902]